MLLTGDPVSAKQAKDIGLINDHFSHNHLEDEVLKLAEKKSRRGGTEPSYSRREQATPRGSIQSNSRLSFCML